jgi:hypothetical protein
MRSDVTEMEVWPVGLRGGPAARIGLLGLSRGATCWSGPG